MLDKNLEPKRLKIEIGGKKLDDSRDFKITDDKTPIIINVHIDQFYDEKADNWAIGILAYELMVGESPFMGYN